MKSINMIDVHGTQPSDLRVGDFQLFFLFMLYVLRESAISATVDALQCICN